jgi:hypothetical protein
MTLLDRFVESSSNTEETKPRRRREKTIDKMARRRGEVNSQEDNGALGGRKRVESRYCDLSEFSSLKFVKTKRKVICGWKRTERQGGKMPKVLNLQPTFNNCETRSSRGSFFGWMDCARD